MDDLLKQVQGHLGGGAGAATPDGAGGGLGAIGGVLGQGGLGGILGQGGLGAILGGGGGPTAQLLPSLLEMLGNSPASGLPGVHQLVENMHGQGMGGKAASWVGAGPGESITPDEAEQALGPDKVQQLSASSGLPVDQVKQALSTLLPGVVDRLTPDGKLPDPAQLQSMIGGLIGR